jgi:hypothetical protein
MLTGAGRLARMHAHSLKGVHMESQQFIVNVEVLTDGSKVYDVVAFDGNSRVTLHAVSRAHAEDLAAALNDGLSGMTVAVHA